MAEVQEIRKVALKLFTRYGLNSVNMDDLAYELGISKKTLYQHFSSKEELVFSVFEMIKASWEATVKEIKELPHNDFHKLFAFFNARYDFMIQFNPAFLLKSGMRYRTIFEFINKERKNIQLLQTKLIKQIEDAGYFHEFVSMEYLLPTLESIFEFHFQYFKQTKADPKGLFNHSIYLLIAGAVDPQKYNPSQELRSFMVANPAH